MNDRLSKLEEELDQLINVQEKIKEQSKVKFDSTARFQHLKPNQHQCSCMTMTTCTQTLASNHNAVTQCSAPIADISKFLQHINFNLSKGTQAINKIANANLQKMLNNNENKNYHESCVKKEESLKDAFAINLCGKKIDEDALFKELREEKDKRLRAENQTKRLKDELKKTKCELKDSANQIQLQLQNKLKDSLKQLEIAKNELEKRDQELQKNEYLWPYKYETIFKQLQDEQIKKSEAEKKVKELQETLQKVYVDTREYLRLQETISLLKEQNESLICLSKRLKADVEEKTSELVKKSGIIDQNLSKIQQLTSLCEKLRDFLVIMRQKNLTNEEKLQKNQILSKKLTDKLLEAQTLFEQSQKQQLQDKLEHYRLTELFKMTNTTNNSLQARIDEMSQIMNQQNCLIAQQSETISVKEGELKLAYENCKNQSKRLEELEKSMMEFSKQKNRPHLENEIESLALQLKIQKENVFIKEKIIESNLETISQLKNKLANKEEDTNNGKRELAERDRKLAIEQTNNEQLQSKIKLLLNRKEELKRKVEELEEELENQVSLDHSKRIEQIEKQVREKQLEWEEQKANLVKEKLDAIESLKQLEERFSVNMNDYEEKIAVYQQNICKLECTLTAKEEQLKKATETILILKSELQESAEIAEKTKKSFEEKLRSACEAWQKTMQLFQNC